MNSLIETKGLSKYYGKGNEIKAVDGLDLTVYEGETFGLHDQHAVHRLPSDGVPDHIRYGVPLGVAPGPHGVGGCPGDALPGVPEAQQHEVDVNGIIGR
jgi:hypothetical protein